MQKGRRKKEGCICLKNVFESKVLALVCNSCLGFVPSLGIIPHPGTCRFIQCSCGPSARDGKTGCVSLSWLVQVCEQSPGVAHHCCPLLLESHRAAFQPSRCAELLARALGVLGFAEAQWESLSCLSYLELARWEATYEASLPRWMDWKANLDASSPSRVLVRMALT